MKWIVCLLRYEWVEEVKIKDFKNVINFVEAIKSFYYKT